MFSWKKQPRGSYVAEIGDLRVVVKEYNEYWWLSMGIRSYSSDMSVGMFRPAVNIIQFPKPCTEEQALELANDYMEKFIGRIVSDASGN